jgi:hypothetical protein
MVKILIILHYFRVLLTYVCLNHHYFYRFGSKFNLFVRIWDLFLITNLIQSHILCDKIKFLSVFFQICIH